MYIRSVATEHAAQVLQSASSSETVHNKPEFSFSLSYCLVFCWSDFGAFPQHLRFLCLSLVDQGQAVPRVAAVALVQTVLGAALSQMSCHLQACFFISTKGGKPPTSHSCYKKAKCLTHIRRLKLADLLSENRGVQLLGMDIAFKRKKETSPTWNLVILPSSWRGQGPVKADCEEERIH